MKLTELFEQNPNIIINTDIDGFLSGMILQTYLGCKIVGFSNSKKEVWVEPTIMDIYQPIYIDLFVSRPDVYCVEQHIIAIDDTHRKNILAMGTKINPNLERDKRNFLDDYYHKYPFATVHYLIARLCKEGINVVMPDLDTVTFTANREYQMELGHIILRADDAMFSSLSKYKDNADDWWQWLYETSDNALCIQSFMQFIARQSREKAKEQKQNIGLFFTKGLQCDGEDGAFTYITDEEGNLQPRILAYAKFLKQSFGWECDLPKSYIVHKGEFLKRFTNPKTINEVRQMIENSSMYSYAFIYGPHSEWKNFSYTINMDTTNIE